MYYCGQILPCFIETVALQSYDDYIVQAYANNPVMKLLRAQTELARNEIRSTKSFSLPGISLYASNTLARPVSRTLADMYNNNLECGRIGFLSFILIV